MVSLVKAVSEIKPTENGIIYCAIGVNSNDQCFVSAKSVKLSNPDIPICVFGDTPPRGPYSKFIDYFCPIPQTRLWDLINEHRLYGSLKLLMLDKSPFAKTLLLDTDTIVTGDISTIFDLLDSPALAMSKKNTDYEKQGVQYQHKSDLLLCADCTTRQIRKKTGGSSWRMEHGEINYLSDQFNNAGVLLYNTSLFTSKTNSFFNEWIEAFKRDCPETTDQLSLNKILAETPGIIKWSRMDNKIYNATSRMWPILKDLNLWSEVKVFHYGSRLNCNSIRLNPSYINSLPELKGLQKFRDPSFCRDCKDYRFTIKSNMAGLGDQITQLNDVYKFFRKMRFRYVYSPFKLGHVSTKENEDLINFLGIYANEKSIEEDEFKSFKLVKVNLMSLITNPKLSSYIDIERSLRLSHPEGNIIFEVQFTLDCYGRFSEALRRFGKIEERFSYKFLDKFRESKVFRDNFNIKSPFKKSDSKKIVVHVRRGDTGIINSKSGALDLKLNKSYKNITEAIKYRNENDNKKYIKTKEYAKKLDEIISTYIKEDVEVVIVSDGYGRNAQDPKVTEKEFSVFDKYNPKYFVGKSHKNFFAAILSFISCDVIICHQGGFSKFIRYLDIKPKLVKLNHKTISK